MKKLTTDFQNVAFFVFAIVLMVFKRDLIQSTQTKLDFWREYSNFLDLDLLITSLEFSINFIVLLSILMFVVILKAAKLNVLTQDVYSQIHLTMLGVSVFVLLFAIAVLPTIMLLKGFYVQHGLLNLFGMFYYPAIMFAIYTTTVVIIKTAKAIKNVLHILKVQTNYLS